jgi:hypothetical protein
MDSETRKFSLRPKEVLRTDWERRQTTSDRRVSGVDQRLRRGLWLEFHRRTDLGKFELLPISLRTRDNLFEAALRESLRYRFFDRNTGVEMPSVSLIGAAVDAVWDSFPGTVPREQRAVFIIDAVADYLLKKFEVSMIDRRDSAGASRAAAS